MTPLLPLAAVGLVLWAWRTFTAADEKAMVGADESGAFSSYPKGCTGEPIVKAHSVPGGGVYRVCIWQCAGTPYTHYTVAQPHLSPNWIGFQVGSNGKRKFWRGSGTAAEINRMCVDLGVSR